MKGAPEEVWGCYYKATKSTSRGWTGWIDESTRLTVGPKFPGAAQGGETRAIQTGALKLAVLSWTFHNFDVLFGVSSSQFSSVVSDIFWSLHFDQGSPVPRMVPVCGSLVTGPQRK